MNEGATILVIDDAPVTLALLRGVLTAAGYQVRLADSGELALKTITSDPPDLILLDVYMAGIDGFEVCRRVKQRDQTRQIPVILISGAVGSSEVLKGLQLGAADYITKPFQTEELLARVRIHLSLGRAIVSLEQRAASLRDANEQLRSEIANRERIEGELRSSLDLAERSRLAMLSALEDQKRTETALRQSELRLRDITSSMGGWVWEIDENGVYTYSSMRGNQLFGDPIGKTLLDFMPPDEARRIAAALSDIVARRAPMVDLEHWNTTKDGDRVCLLTNGVPIIDTEGNFKGYRGVARDITGRKRAADEKARLEAQLQQAQKMESVGRLAGGVAHDFNNMLGAILGHAELALEQLDPTQPLFDDLREIQKAATRSADLTRQLLAFARKQTVTPTVLDLNDTVEGMLKMLDRLIGEDITLKWHPRADLLPIKMDPSQLDQILANLCVNARDAISGVGEVTIETDQVTLSEDYCAAHPGVVPGDYVKLTVSDNGCGMNKDVLSHLFEPFFTTKATGQGTGLGLATVYGIVKQNNGAIYVYSEPDQGTTFSIYLPSNREGVGHERTGGAAAPPRRGCETILVVEDEAVLLTLATKMLARQGYTVLAANTPGEAIRLAAEYPSPIDLLMTDVVMPEMNGRMLARNVLALHPRMKRLFMSGYTADIIAHRGVLDDGVHFIQKPFSVESLSAKVREALDSDERVEDRSSETRLT